mmetsp:Transcript_8052/g.5732  ORF Transcript_8052/g.5732 Transcript_8052/m.5732 type:complete len:102 (-) Transcript_8052:31-336(-)
MYGFGDDKDVREDSLDLMESFVEEFIGNLIQRTMSRGVRAGHNSLKLADVLKVIEPDDKKFLRMPYILSASRSIDAVKNCMIKTTEHMDHSDKKNLLSFEK